MTKPTRRELARTEQHKELLVATQAEMDKPRGDRLAGLRGLLGDGVVNQWLRAYSSEEEIPDDGRSIFDDEEDGDGE